MIPNPLKKEAYNKNLSNLFRKYSLPIFSNDDEN